MITDKLCKRYTGIQTLLNNIGSDGCYFLSLCSIIEEVNNSPIDLLEVVRVSFENKWIISNYYVNDAISILNHFTDKRFKLNRLEALPDLVKDNEFTIEKWYNERTGFTHFKRRFVDTLKSSVTVKEGYIKEYYFFWYNNEE